MKSSHVFNNNMYRFSRISTKLSSFIYKHSLPVNGREELMSKVSMALFRLLRKGVLLMGDPPCEMNIRGKTMAMPLSHQLPSYTSFFANYDSNLLRISDFLRARDGYLHQIDVGANIGDSILACFNSASDVFLAIEPCSLFHAYLKTNLGKFPTNVILEKFLCASTNGHTNIQVNQIQGTAAFKVISSSRGESIESRTVDSAVRQHPIFADCNFLKIDTDGYDFDVIKGAINLIGSATPFVLFESYPFGNMDYFKQVKATLSFFAKSGYTQAVVYDNTGNIFTVLSLEDFKAFDHALLYELIGDHLYFDILVLKHAPDFVRLEYAYFLNAIADRVRKQAAIDAIESIHRSEIECGNQL